jgi:hypothetical protein
MRWMPGFDALYKQTVTVFNRVKDARTQKVLWYANVIENVHLIIDKSSSWSGQGTSSSDTARLHIRYSPSGNNAVVICKDGTKIWHEPKEWRRLEDKDNTITFAYGDAEVFDFFVEGAFTEYASPIDDDSFERKGFYNYMNSRYDNVFAISSVSKYNLIPHFVIMAR